LTTLLKIKSATDMARAELSHNGSELKSRDALCPHFSPALIAEAMDLLGIQSRGAYTFDAEGTL